MIAADGSPVVAHRLWEPMTFRLLLHCPEGLYSLYKIDVRPSGVYIASTLPGLGDTHVSYHTDGNCFIHSRGEMRKGRRQPLSDFQGIETIHYVPFIVFRPSPDSIPVKRTSSGDIVVIRDDIFGVEVILSDRILALPEFPGRLNSVQRSSSSTA
jgi:hypothetical protein